MTLSAVDESNGHADGVGDGDGPALTRRIGRNTAWVAAGRLADIVAVVLANMILARWLSPGDFKTFLVLFNVVSLLSICATLGLNRSIVRFLSEYLAKHLPGHARHVLRTATVWTFVGSIICALAMVFLTSTFAGETTSTLLAAGLTFSVMLRAFQRLASESLRGYHEIRYASLFAGQNAGQACGPMPDLLFMAFIAVAQIWMAPSLATAVLLNAFSLVVTVPYAGYVLYRVMKLSLANADTAPHAADDTTRFGMRELLVVSIGTMLTQVFVFLTWYSDLWLADFLLPTESATQYVVARNLLLMIMLPLGLINLAVLSTIPELHSQGRLDRLQQVLRTSAGLAAIPSLLAIVALAIGGRWILTIFFGEFYADGAPVLVILAMGRIASTICGAGGFALMMTGYERVYLAIGVVTTIALWVFGTLAAQHYGPLGLAVVTSISFILHHLAILLAVRKYVGVWAHPMLPKWNRPSRANRRSVAIASESVCD